eukprot:gene5322-8123_t
MGGIRLLLGCAGAFAAVAANGEARLASPVAPVQHVIQQPLDHNNRASSPTFGQRYWTNAAGVTDNSSARVFFLCGGESPLESTWDNIGQPFEWAAEFNALVVATEHRYYGQSVPDLHRSAPAAFYQFLTMEQALQDYVEVLTKVKADYRIPKEASVIAVGGSYSGVLSALLRVHYPEVYHMSVAASAPWLQLMGLSSPTKYFEIVSANYLQVSRSCHDTIRNGFSAVMDHYVAGGAYAALSELFHTCDPVTPRNLDNFLDWLRNAFSDLAQTNYPYAIGAMPGHPVAYVCENIVAKANATVPTGVAAAERLARVAEFYYNNATNGGTLECLNVSFLFPYCSDRCWCGTGEAAASWNYQQCTEVTIPTVTTNVTDVFPPSVWLLGNLTDWCGEKYGVTPVPRRMQEWQPAAVQNASSRIVWSTGTADPWGGGCFQDNFTGNAEMPVLRVEGGAHHYDMRLSNANDTASVREANVTASVRGVHNTERVYLWTWLAEHEARRT